MAFCPWQTDGLRLHGLQLATRLSAKIAPMQCNSALMCTRVSLVYKWFHGATGRVSQLQNYANHNSPFIAHGPRVWNDYRIAAIRTRAQ